HSPGRSQSRRCPGRPSPSSACPTSPGDTTGCGALVRGTGFSIAPKSLWVFGLWKGLFFRPRGGAGGSRMPGGSGDPGRKCGHLDPILGAGINSASASSLLPGRGKQAGEGSPSPPRGHPPRAASSRSPPSLTCL
uniref:Uncharacterized protein n=1 Tax=Serinus canaria TaxID=9135 RepID=A0A8C9MIM3_SERCA